MIFYSCNKVADENSKGEKMIMIENMTEEELREKAKWCADSLENLRAKLRDVNDGKSIHFNGIQDIQSINWAIAILRSM